MAWTDVRPYCVRGSAVRVGTKVLPRLGVSRAPPDWTLHTNRRSVQMPDHQRARLILLSDHSYGGNIRESASTTSREQRNFSGKRYNTTPLTATLPEKDCRNVRHEFGPSIKAGIARRGYDKSGPTMTASVLVVVSNI